MEQTYSINIWSRFVDQIVDSLVPFCSVGAHTTSRVHGLRSTLPVKQGRSSRPVKPPFPQIDIIGAVVIVWRVRGKTIRSVLCNIVCNNCAQCDAYMNRLTVLWIGFCLTGPISLCLDSFLWPPYVIGGPLYFCPVVSFFFLSFYLFFFPRLISAAAGWMSTILWHMVWP